MALPSWKSKRFCPHVRAGGFLRPFFCVLHGPAERRSTMQKPFLTLKRFFACAPDGKLTGCASERAGRLAVQVSAGAARCKARRRRLARKRSRLSGAMPAECPAAEGGHVRPVRKGEGERTSEMSAARGVSRHRAGSERAGTRRCLKAARKGRSYGGGVGSLFMALERGARKERCAGQKSHARGVPMEHVPLR